MFECISRHCFVRSRYIIVGIVTKLMNAAA